MISKLKSYNEEIFNSYLKLERIEELSSPLLVSSKRFLNIIKKNPIMYIGQETYEWINYNKDINDISLDTIEDSYDNFLIDYQTSKSIFWQFIKGIINSNYSDIASNVVWINTLIVGNRYSKGHPIVDDKIKNLSLSYLLFLYEYFEPSIVVNVSGNCNPYYEITRLFLEKINSNIKDLYPTSDKPIIIDNNSNIVWTYHPRQLRYRKEFNNAVNEIRKLN